MSEQTHSSTSQDVQSGRIAMSDQQRMLAPTAYSESLLPSLRLARSSRFARRIGKGLLLGLVIGFGFVAIAPWQQSVTGNGTVIAFAPTERQQTIAVMSKGRVVRWGENVYENAHVSKGDLIAEVQDIDPQFMGRLEEQLEASESVVSNATDKLAASRRKLEAARRVVTSQEQLLQTYESAKAEVLGSADAAIAGAQNKVDAERKKLDEHEAALTQLEADYIRQKQLFEEEIVAGVKFQKAEAKYLQQQARVAAAKEYIQSATNELTGKKRDREAKAQEAEGKINSARSYLDKAIGDVAYAESEVAKAESDLNKARKGLSEMQTKLSRQQSQRIVAPFDGFLTSINANMGSQFVKEGDTLCVIVPDTKDRAVQIWLDGNDAPLVDVGRHVRLQFEGWPAVQFGGWPSVAVGTFAGTVVSLDATDNGKGKFRALVRPDSTAQQAWPNERFLRQGVQAHAWVLLEKVPLWYEIWRNMNGFPPVVTQENELPKAKKPKLPK